MRRRFVIFFCSLTVLILAGINTGFGEEEQLTITTYYPSPYGSYNELRLYPHSPPVTPCDSNNDRGTMYYNSNDDLVYVCKGVGKGWQPMAPIPAGMIAMFTNACPSGWTRFIPLDGRVPKGAAAYGVTGGDANHTHGVTAGPAGGEIGSVVGAAVSSIGLIAPGTTYLQTTPASSEWPPYLEVIWCKKD